MWVSLQAGGGHFLRGGRVTLRVGVVAGLRHSPHREGYNLAKIYDGYVSTFLLKPSGHFLRGGRVTLRVGVVTGLRRSPHREGYNHAKIYDSRICVNFSLKAECNRPKP